MDACLRTRVGCPANSDAAGGSGGAFWTPVATLGHPRQSLQRVLIKGNSGPQPNAVKSERELQVQVQVLQRVPDKTSDIFRNPPKIIR